MVSQGLGALNQRPIVTNIVPFVADQCKQLIDKAHIYLTSNGRISMAGLNTKTVEYVAQSIDKVVRGQL